METQLFLLNEKVIVETWNRLNHFINDMDRLIQGLYVGEQKFKRVRVGNDESHHYRIDNFEQMLRELKVEFNEQSIAHFLYVALELPKIGALDHGLYNRDYFVIYSPEVLARELKKIDNLVCPKEKIRVKAKNAAILYHGTSELFEIEIMLGTPVGLDKMHFQFKNNFLSGMKKTEILSSGMIFY